MLTTDTFNNSIQQDLLRARKKEQATIQRLPQLNTVDNEIKANLLNLELALLSTKIGHDCYCPDPEQPQPNIHVDEINKLLTKITNEANKATAAASATTEDTANNEQPQTKRPVSYNLNIFILALEQILNNLPNLLNASNLQQLANLKIFESSVDVQKQMIATSLNSAQHAFEERNNAAGQEMLSAFMNASGSTLKGICDFRAFNNSQPRELEGFKLLQQRQDNYLQVTQKTTNINLTT